MAERVRAKERDGGGGSYFAAPAANVHFFSSGCKLLDLMLGGGWAEERICNVVGDKSTGKTLLMIEACANFILKYPKGKIHYRECESAFDRGYASTLGMPVEVIDFGDKEGPLETVEDLFEDIEWLVGQQKKVKSPQPILYIVDSLDALTDRSEMKRDIDEGSFGANKAKQMSQLFRRLVRKLTYSRMTLMIVSQVRDKIGMMVGKKTTRSGGRALDFYASQVVYLTQMGRVKRTVGGVERPVALQIRAYADKNKVGLPFREANFNIQFGYGIDDISACVEWLIKVKARGAPASREDYLKKYNKMSDEDARDERKRLHQMVEEEWYGIEKRFLPARKKYG